VHCRVAYINSAFHPPGIGKSSTSILAGVKARRVHSCRVAASNTVWSHMAGSSRTSSRRGLININLNPPFVRPLFGRTCLNPPVGGWLSRTKAMKRQASALQYRRTTVNTPALVTRTTRTKWWWSRRPRSRCHRWETSSAERSSGIEVRVLTTSQMPKPPRRNKPPNPSQRHHPLARVCGVAQRVVKLLIRETVGLYRRNTLIRCQFAKLCAPRDLLCMADMVNPIEKPLLSFLTFFS